MVTGVQRLYNFLEIYERSGIWVTHLGSGPEPRAWVTHVGPSPRSLRVVRIRQMPPEPPGATWACLGGMSYPLSEHAESCHMSWDGLQFLCVSLCWRLLKSMSYTFSEHAERLLFAQTVFNFYAFACAEHCSTIRAILSQSMQKVAIIWDILQFLCISLCRRLPKSTSYPFSEHAERLILAEMVVNFYALAYARDS